MEAVLPCCLEFWVICCTAVLNARNAPKVWLHNLHFARIKDAHPGTRSVALEAREGRPMVADAIAAAATVVPAELGGGRVSKGPKDG